MRPRERPSGSTIRKPMNSGSPAAVGFVHRGVANWSDGEQHRIFIGTCDAYLIALDANTGKPVPAFGENGRIDLTEGLRRPVDRDYYPATRGCHKSNGDSHVGGRAEIASGSDIDTPAARPESSLDDRSGHGISHLFFTQIGPGTNVGDAHPLLPLSRDG